jgi:hypothetical protein
MSRRRLGVTLEQLAWYLERDGWRYLHATAGGRVYGRAGELAVEVLEADVPELDRRRDEVYRRLRDRQLGARP